MTDVIFQGKSFHVHFDWSFIQMHPEKSTGQDTWTCYISTPTWAVADTAICATVDQDNTRKGQRIALERAARRLATRLWKQGGPRPRKIKNAFMSAYNDAVLKEINPELWQQVQEKKAQQKQLREEKQKALKEENARIKANKKRELASLQDIFLAFEDNGDDTTHTEFSTD